MNDSDYIEYKNKLINTVAQHLVGGVTYANLLAQAKKNNTLEDDECNDFIRELSRNVYARKIIEQIEESSIKNDPEQKSATVMIPLLCPFVELSKEQIERGLKSPYPSVRAMYANMPDIKLTQKQINILLYDDHAEVLLAVIQREDVELSKGQIEMTLKNKNLFVLCALAMKNNVLLSKEQVEDGIEKVNSLTLTKKNLVGLDALLRKSFESNLKNGSKKEEAKKAFKDYCVSYETNKFNAMYKKHPDSASILEIIEFPLANLDEEMVEKLLDSDDLTACLACVTRKRTRLTQSQVDKIFSKTEGPVGTVKLAVINRDDIVLTPSQIESALTDADPIVRCGIVSKRGINLTKEQIRRGLKDKDKDVKMGFVVYNKGKDDIYEAGFSLGREMARVISQGSTYKRMRH